VVPADMSLRSIIRLRQASGHPVLVADAGCIVGVCGEADIILALAGAGQRSTA
jgi:glycine betaine/proline transport system ATP-binding protein